MTKGFNTIEELLAWMKKVGANSIVNQIDTLVIRLPKIKRQYFFEYNRNILGKMILFKSRGYCDA